MLKNYDRGRRLEYIINLLKKVGTSDPAIHEIIDFLKSEENFEIDLPNPRRSGVKANFTAEHKKQLLTALENLKSKLQIGKASHIKERVDYCAGYYHLNKHEHAVFAFIVRAALDKGFSRFLDDLVERGPFDVSEIISVATGISLPKTNEALYASNRLSQCYLITKEHDRCNRFNYTLPEPLHLAFTTPLKSPENIRESLIGRPDSSNLSWGDFAFMGEERELAASILTQALSQQTKGVNILLYGPPGTGKTEFCKALAEQIGANIYPVADEKLDGSMAGSEYRLENLLVKQKWMGNNEKALLLFDEMEDILVPSVNFVNNTQKTSKSFFNRLLEQNPHPVLWTCNSVRFFDEAFIRRMSLAIELKSPSRKHLKQILVKTAANSSVELEDQHFEEISAYENISPAVFASAVRAAELSGGNVEQVRTGVKSLIRAMQAGQPVKTKAEPGRFQFRQDLVNTDIDLQVMTHALEKAPSTAFSLCLYGPPGTGKSAYGRYLAERLGIDVVFKRGSDIFQPFVGMTEKAIAQAFEEAYESNAMLIIDEADSFLRSREGANKSWEVTSVNEMLTWLESHPLPVVFTTNDFNTLDTASLRRFTFKVKFDYLGVEQAMRAFEVFFELSPPEELKSLELLTPGDFANVRNKTDIIGLSHADDPARMISEMLTGECNLKSEKRNPIGFIG